MSPNLYSKLTDDELAYVTSLEKRFNSLNTLCDELKTASLAQAERDKATVKQAEADLRGCRLALETVTGQARDARASERYASDRLVDWTRSVLPVLRIWLSIASLFGRDSFTQEGMNNLAKLRQTVCEMEELVK